MYSSDGVYNPKTKEYETFCKQYKLNDTIYREVLANLTKEVKRKVSVAQVASFEETAVISDAATAKVVENYANIQVPSITQQEEIGINFEHHRVLEGIRAGYTNCRRARSGRIYHRLTNGFSKECRKMIKVDGEYLVSTDFSSFHPFLLGSRIKDAAEKQRWINFCRADPYSQFARMFGGTRDEHKDSFMIAISNCKRKTKAAKQILKIFEHSFPNLLAFIRNIWAKGETMQMTLQKMESYLMIGAFEEANFWCLPIHDAFLVKKTDQQKAVAYLGHYVCMRLGYYIPIKWS